MLLSLVALFSLVPPAEGEDKSYQRAQEWIHSLSYLASSTWYMREACRCRVALSRNKQAKRLKSNELRAPHDCRRNFSAFLRICIKCLQINFSQRSFINFSLWIRLRRLFTNNTTLDVIYFCVAALSFIALEHLTRRG